MFGAVSGSSSYWAISYTFNNTTYYLTSINDAVNKFIWTSNKIKAKHYGSTFEASRVIETIKHSRNDKSFPLVIIQLV